MSDDSANFVQEFGPTILWSEMQRERYFHSELREIGQKMLRAGHDAEVEIEKFRAKLLEREVAPPVSGDGTPGPARGAADAVMAVIGKMLDGSEPRYRTAEGYVRWGIIEQDIRAVLAVPAVPDSGPSDGDQGETYAARAERETRIRVVYQDIVYAVCNVLDREPYRAARDGVRLVAVRERVIEALESALRDGPNPEALFAKAIRTAEGLTWKSAADRLDEYAHRLNEGDTRDELFKLADNWRSWSVPAPPSEEPT